MSDSLIGEIQKAAIDPRSEVSTLLRQLKLAAAKLKIETIGEWVESELNGYPNGREVPSYRKITGSPMVLTLYSGWEPLMLEKKIDFLRTVNIGNSVAGIEALLSEKDSSHLRPYPSEFVANLSKANGGQVTQAGCMLSRSSFASILDAVRNLVLNWAIEMEGAGVRGQGLSFTPAEQTSAQQASAVFNIQSIGTFTGAIGVGNVSGDIISAPLNVKQVEHLISQVKSHAEGLTNEGVSGADLSAVVKSLEEAIANKKPDLIRSALNELQKVIAKGTGGLLAHGVLGLLHQILGTGIPTV